VFLHLTVQNNFKFPKYPSPLLLISPLPLPLCITQSPCSHCNHLLHFSSFSSQMALSCSKALVFSLSNVVGCDDAKKKLTLCSSSSSFSPSVKGGGSKNMRVCAATSGAPSPLTGVIFEPFQELKKDYLAVPIQQNVSLARQNYSDECEAAINEQIKYDSFHSLTFYPLFVLCLRFLVLNLWELKIYYLHLRREVFGVFLLFLLIFNFLDFHKVLFMILLLLSNLN